MRCKRTLIEVCAIVSIIGVVAELLLPGSDHDRTHRYLTAPTSAGSNLAEIAGEYLIETKYGGPHLSILADGRFSHFNCACTGVWDRESGYVRRAGSSYVLSPIKDGQGLSERAFLPVHWQGRCYLIPPGRMEEFCDAIVSGEEPRNGRHGKFYLRAPHEPVVGVPDLPQQWAEYLKQNAIIARVIEVTDGRQVKIDAGKSKGVPPADGVVAVQGRDDYAPIRLFVVSVAEDTSIARLPDLPSHAAPLTVGQYVVLQK